MRYRSMSMLFSIAMVLTTASAHADHGTWTFVPGATTPGPRREYGASFDRESQSFYLFDGFNGNNQGLYILFNDVWKLDVSGTPTWSQIPIAGSLPGPRHSPQWGYDAARNRVLIFGGYGSHVPGSSYAYLNDVWELSLDGTPHWTEITPAGQAPSGRLAGAAVYDPLRQRFVGFGGTIGAPVDTWVLNLQGQSNANWQQLPALGTSPEGRWGMQTVYDSKRDRMVIFGGSIDDGYWGARNDVWELDMHGVPSWSQITVADGVKPKPRRSGSAIYDPLRDRMVIHGGFDAATPGVAAFLGDIWELDFTADPPVWTQLSPAGTNPTGRDAHAAVYDPIHDRMIMHGGWTGADMLADTQFLDWSSSSAEATLTPSSSATPTSAHVEWDVEDATATHGAVYRRAPGTDWTAMGVAEVNASQKLVFDDAAVATGVTYDYMMVVGSQRGETFGGETSVLIPTTTDVGNGARADFALNRISPNPAFGAMSVSFVLASSEPATLDLVDVAGRSMLSREVGSMGEGSHRIDLSTGDVVPPGLYFVRLRQAGRTALSRVAIGGGR